jgi:glycosyltransferase involved in cell wall biosynthesis
MVHPCILTENDVEALQASPIRRGLSWLRYQHSSVTGSYRPNSWMQIEPGIELLCTATPELIWMPPSDVWIATWWYTARWVATYPGARAYLIQHLETWGGPEHDVMTTWKLPLRKIVIARWLKNIASNMQEQADYIPNGLNFQTFGLDLAPETRDPHTVAMLYHPVEWKGSFDGLQALSQVKSIIPDLRVLAFGTFSRPPVLPTWIQYYQNPPQSVLRELYNRAAIFVSPSWTEGWPLPPAEALQCGSALVATDIPGHREYAVPCETALLSPSKNPGALAANITALLRDQEFRIRLAHAGHRHIQQFTWDRALAKFEAVLEEELSLHKSIRHRSTG